MTHSVIIPVYNVATRLRRCLMSLVDAFVYVRRDASSFTAEVICVEDGSTDGSGKMLDELVRNLNVEGLSFVVFHQENAGPSVARNRGLEVALGDWVSFVDSDDEVGLRYFSAFREWPHKADITFFAMTWWYASGEEEIAVLHGYDFVQGRDAVAEASLKLTGVLNDRNLFAYMPNKFIANRLVRQERLRFIEGLSLSEDEAFIFEACLKAESLSVMTEALYVYHVTTTGLTNSPNRPLGRLGDIFYALGQRACEIPLKKLAYGFSLAVLHESALQRVSLAQACKYVRCVRAVRSYFPLSRDCPKSAMRLSAMWMGTAVLWMLIRQMRACLSRSLRS